ncbi:MAG TPA: ATP-binding cassette domain-containing protein [Candidatus Diapherotrites archaeon]|uniref:ATP-binding cassette domain-containing protein n=1 Tax=Candidatus Iainarchaeum sp. TaxID=3101447 RepID=A0A7J4J0L2_9ARCH|nr:ATP-binding cassette domain-containing protein [Candidatus Diapherotrites archaeon]
MPGHSSIISVKGLSKQFGGFKAVDGISFEVRAGEIFAFLGPNGAGKTTTIKMLTTLLDPTAGNIEVDGAPISEKDRVRSSFGIVFQDPSLDDELTAYENMEFHGVLYGIERNAIKERSARMLKLVDLWERKDDLVKTFSGGMKRRLEIARAFIHEPKILYLDEPTIGLDPQTRNHLWDFVKKLNRENGMTVFFTTHYMEEAEKAADRVAIIDHGKIKMIGTSAQIRKFAKAKSLEEAFLKITGRDMREEEASGVEEMRMHRRLWGR